jgi:hypothetical protein
VTQAAELGNADKANAESLNFRALLGHPSGVNPCKDLFGVEGCSQNEPSLSLTVNRKRLLQGTNDADVKYRGNFMNGLVIFKAVHIVDKDFHVVESIDFAAGVGDQAWSEFNVRKICTEVEDGFCTVEISTQKNTTWKRAGNSSFRLLFEVSEVPSANRNGGIVTPTAVKITVEVSSPLTDPDHRLEFEIDMLGAAGMAEAAWNESLDDGDEDIVGVSDLFVSWETVVQDTTRNRRLAVTSKHTDLSHTLPSNIDGATFYYKGRFTFEPGSGDYLWDPKLGLHYEDSKKLVKNSASQDEQQNSPDESDAQSVNEGTDVSGVPKASNACRCFAFMIWLHVFQCFAN